MCENNKITKNIWPVYYQRFSAFINLGEASWMCPRYAYIHKILYTIIIMIKKNDSN